jgi:ABC-type bacteriocin/lantibiotic exporter with double-glycine peptidase domain
VELIEFFISKNKDWADNIAADKHYKGIGGKAMINTAARRNKYSVYNYLNENRLQYSIYVLFRLAYIILALYIPFFLSASIDQISTKRFDVISRSFILFILMAFAVFIVDCECL